MNPRELAKKLIEGNVAESDIEIPPADTSVPAIELAYAIKEYCYEVWTNEPTAAQKAAVAINNLSRNCDLAEIDYIANWITGLSEITKGNLEQALSNFKLAFSGFLILEKEYEAAQTQVAMMIPLGLLGNYSGAIEVGKGALATFESLNDELAAGKIEMNLANIFERQGRYKESKKFCMAARDRFASLNETNWLLMAENDLARELAMLNEFDEAEERYLNALSIARNSQMNLTEAEILASLGNLQTFRGQYGEALRSLELSRKKYSDLEMPHHYVIADLEIAEIYQILNLTDEANEIYSRVTEELKGFGMKAEEAWARANFGQLSVAAGNLERAEIELAAAADLYLEVGNPAGAGSVKLRQAKLLSDRGENDKALEQLEIGLKFAEEGEFKRLEIECRYLEGEILRMLGRTDRAIELLTNVIKKAINSEQLGIVVNCHVSLARIAIAKEELDQAEFNLGQAIDTVERLRAPIPADEFRMAFLADKLAPFELSAEVYLRKGDLESAFCLTERARSRTLFEKLNTDKNREFKSATSVEYKQLREILNWSYSRLARESGDDEDLRDEIARIETKLAELSRIDSSITDEGRNLEGRVDWSALPKKLVNDLGKDRTLIEYTTDGENISAYVVDGKGIDYFENISNMNEISELLEGLRFQFESMRFDGVGGFAEQLKERTDKYLEVLHENLIKPLQARLDSGNFVIVPVGPVFYVPFCALFDGKNYLVESNTICYAPSAAIWWKLRASWSFTTGQALVLSYADDKSPQIVQEVAEVSRIVEAADVFAGSSATLENYFANSGEANIVHLACHGEFRADNPMFSNLRLADGFLTVRDIAEHSLNADLVTLSACETGLNKVFAGEEILGLTRGFLGAGANRLMISFWKVDDEATSVLMESFYNLLMAGNHPGESLRNAQKHFIEAGKHPYFWAPFAMIGK